MNRNKNVSIHLFLAGLFLFSCFFIFQFIREVEITLPIEIITYILPVWALLVYGILVAPVIEEFSFRSWQKLNGKRKIIAPVCFMLFALASKNYLVFTFALFIVISYWAFFERLKPVFIIIPTSIVFAVIHLPEDYQSLDFYFFLAGYLGIGLIFSFVRLRFSLSYAVLLHTGWNFIFLFLMNYKAFHFCAKTYNLQSDMFSIKLKRCSIFDFQLGNNSKYGSDTIETLFENKKDIITSLTFDNDVIMRIRTNPFEHYSLKVMAHKGKKINYYDLQNKIFPMMDVVLDTALTLKTGYEIQLINKEKFKPADYTTVNFDKKITTTTVRHFAKALQQRYEIPFFSNDTSEIVVVYNPGLSVRSQLKDLEKRYGFQFRKIKKKMNVITVKDNF